MTVEVFAELGNMNQTPIQDAEPVETTQEKRSAKYPYISIGGEVYCRYCRWCAVIDIEYHLIHVSTVPGVHFKLLLVPAYQPICNLVLSCHVDISRFLCTGFLRFVVLLWEMLVKMDTVLPCPAVYVQLLNTATKSKVAAASTGCTLTVV